MPRTRKSAIRARTQRSTGSRFIKQARQVDVVDTDFTPESEEDQTSKDDQTSEDSQTSEDDQNTEDGGTSSDDSKRNQGKRPVIYTGNSERTACRKRKLEADRVASVQDCNSEQFAKFFQKPPLKPHYLSPMQTQPELDTVIIDHDLDLLDHGYDYTLWDETNVIWADELQAALDGNREDFFLSPEPFKDENMTLDDTLIDIPSEGVLSQSGRAALNKPALAEARQSGNENTDDHVAPPNILNIVQTLLSDSRKCRTTRAVKALMPLTALTHFVKLQANYLTNPRCKRPSISASLNAARRMGKGPYFAHKIRELEVHILTHGALPIPKKQVEQAHLTLLDNEVILQGI
ncbi:hypothetical protein JB92DRAFT_2836904 [Gautieria morchelliformis]|nr:hypothetical protein JB92DRAFT_2836904 [Gautieria morchelliformis]